MVVGRTTDPDGVEDGFDRVVIDSGGSLYIAGIVGNGGFDLDGLVLKLDPRAGSLEEATSWKASISAVAIDDEGISTGSGR